MDAITGEGLHSFLDLHGIGENLVGHLVISGRGHHEQATNITPPPQQMHYSIFYSIFFTELLHDSVLLFRHLQGADTKVSIKLTAIK
jgi:hypothetical protein